MVHLESGDDVVIIEGTAERVRDVALLEGLVDPYERKYGVRVDFTDESFAVYVARPRRAFAWFERTFPTTATRWRFDA